MNNKELEFLDFVQTVNGLNIVDYQYFHNLLNNRTIILNSEIDESILETVVLPLQQFEKDDSVAPVTLYLNTPGGSVADGLMLCNIIDNYKKKLNIIVPSYACSMGTIILCSGNNNPNVTKYAYPFSFALIHSGQTLVGGEATSVEDIVSFNKEVDNRIREYIIKNTNITEEMYNEHHRKQWYISAPQMVAFGLVDKIIGCDE